MKTKPPVNTANIYVAEAAQVGHRNDRENYMAYKDSGKNCSNNPARRKLMIAGGSAAAATVAAVASAGTSRFANAANVERRGFGNNGTKGNGSGKVVTKDGTNIFYKDWGTGQPVVFSHGWPLNADAWDAQMTFLGAQGFRVIAHDRRSHGRSDQTWEGNDMDTYADDLATLMDSLDLTNAMLVGHSTGGGEVARYIGRHGTKRLSKAVLIGAVTPLMLKTGSNPGGLPISVFDSLRSGVAANRSQFYQDLAIPFYGFNKPGVERSNGTVNEFWLQGMQGGLKGQLDCIKQFSEVDFTEDLKKIDVPTLILHGDADQIVPIADSALLSSKIVKDGTLKIYPNGSHGMCTTLAAQINADLLAFLKQ